MIIESTTDQPPDQDAEGWTSRPSGYARYLEELSIDLRKRLATVFDAIEDTPEGDRK